MGWRTGSRGSPGLTRPERDSLARVIGGAPLPIAENGKSRSDFPSARLGVRIVILVGVVHPHQRAIGSADHRIFRPRSNSQDFIMVSGHGPRAILLASGRYFAIE